MKIVAGAVLDFAECEVFSFVEHVFREEISSGVPSLRIGDETRDVFGRCHGVFSFGDVSG